MRAVGSRGFVLSDIALLVAQDSGLVQPGHLEIGTFSAARHSDLVKHHFSSKEPVGLGMRYGCLLSL